MLSEKILFFKDYSVAFDKFGSVDTGASLPFFPRLLLFNLLKINVDYLHYFNKM